jgi:uncharacterized membrane protein YbhN (UPF0104 family)
MLGGTLYLLAFVVADLPPARLIRVVGAFAISWVAGFIVPTAPAGLGVREGILVTLLPLDPDSALAVVFGFRLGTSVGDLVTFGVGTVLSLGNAPDRAAS